MYKDWVKKLGQWHLYKPDSSETLCGTPMLGNNYSRLILPEHREKCEDCFKIKRKEEKNDA